MYGLSQPLLTVDHPSRVGVPVCSVSDAPAAQLICFLYCHVLTVTTVHHTIGITVTTAGGEHLSRQASPIMVHVIQTRALESAHYIT